MNAHVLWYIFNTILLCSKCTLKMKHKSKMEKEKETEMDGDGKRKGARECVFHQSQPCQAIWTPISEA